MARNGLHLYLMISYEYNTPGYHKNNGGTNGCSQV